MLNRLIFKLYLYFIGFYFTSIEIDDKHIMFYSSVVNLNYGDPLTFNFYKKEIERFVVRYGKMKSIKVMQYSIVPIFTEDHPKKISMYNEQAMTFEIPYYYLIKEDDITYYLLNIYLDYLIKYIK